MTNAIAERSSLTALEIRAQVNLIQQVMAEVMKKDTHYGVIPGCVKPSLYKPGAEKLLVTFRIAAEPVVEDLSTADVARYRVTSKGTSILTGVYVGSGVGEASSDEEKYKWRFVACEAEFDATPEDRRRLKYKKDGSTIKQVRTNPADVANTILKMADKRSFVALALKVTAASDCFVQDVEDLPEGMDLGESKTQAPPADPPRRASETKADAGAQKSLDNAADADKVTFIPAAVSVKSGEKNGKPWKKYGIKSPADVWYGTFDTELGELALQAKDERFNIKLTYKHDGQYLTVTEIVRA